MMMLQRLRYRLLNVFYHLVQRVRVKMVSTIFFQGFISRNLQFLFIIAEYEEYVRRKKIAEQAQQALEQQPAPTTNTTDSKGLEEENRT